MSKHKKRPKNGTKNRTETPVVRNSVQFGPREFAEAAAPPKPSFAEIGVAGDDFTNGLPTDPYNDKLAGQEWMAECYRMICSGGYVEALRRAVVTPILATEWDVSGDNDQATEFVRNNLLDSSSDTAMSDTWQDVLERALECVFYGVWCFEKVWRDEGGKVTLRRLVDRLPRSIAGFDIDPDGTLTGIHQKGTRPNGDQVDKHLAIENLLLFPYRRRGNNWFGFSILRPAHVHWNRVMLLSQLLDIGSERSMTPSPVGNLPAAPTPTDAERAKFSRALNAWRTNSSGVLVLPSGYTVSDLSKLAGADIAGVLAYRNEEITWIVRSGLADFLMLGESARALGDVKIRFFLMTLEAIANAIEAIFNRFLVKQLVGYNFKGLSGSDMPRLTHRPVGQDMNMEAAAAFLKVLLDGQFIIPEGPTDENFWRRQMGLPEKDETPAAPLKQVGTAPADTAEPAVAGSPAASAEVGPSGSAGAGPTPSAKQFGDRGTGILPVVTEVAQHMGGTPMPRTFSEADVTAAAARLQVAGAAQQDDFQQLATASLRSILGNLLAQVEVAGADPQRIAAIVTPDDLVAAYASDLARWLDQVWQVAATEMARELGRPAPTSMPEGMAARHLARAQSTARKQVEDARFELVTGALAGESADQLTARFAGVLTVGLADFQQQGGQAAAGEVNGGLG